MSFLAWMLFVPLWLTFSYTVGAFSVWGGGFLFQWGVIDYCGGYVIHIPAGVAGFTAAYWVGPRTRKDRERFPPNNILFALTGAGLLWMGWAGFNGGGPYAANVDASMAVLNTNICTAASLIVWTCLDVVFFKKPSVVGAVQAVITGLVCITPGAGTYFLWICLCALDHHACMARGLSLGYGSKLTLNSKLSALPEQWRGSVYPGKEILSARRIVLLQN
jgi:Amt family ammonium transporter